MGTRLAGADAPPASHLQQSISSRWLAQRDMGRSQEGGARAEILEVGWWGCRQMDGKYTNTKKYKWWCWRRKSRCGLNRTKTDCIWMAKSGKWRIFVGYMKQSDFWPRCPVLWHFCSSLFPVIWLQTLSHYKGLKVLGPLCSVANFPSGHLWNCCQENPMDQKRIPFSHNINKLYCFYLPKSQLNLERLLHHPVCGLEPWKGRVVKPRTHSMGCRL